MFLDASAVVAIIDREPGYESLLERIHGSPTRLHFSPVSRFEAIFALARILAGKHRSATPQEVDNVAALVDGFFAQVGAHHLDLTAAISLGAQQAAQTYGRCVGHPAALNLGDCFAHACAKATGVGLIYKGEDFGKTDMAAVPM